MKDLYIIGAGGLGREILWLVREINRKGNAFNVRGFVDDNPALHGQQICDIPVLGKIELLKEERGACAALGIGIPRIKQKILQTVGDYELEWPALIAPSVEMSGYVKVGRGAVICAGSILTTQVEVGDFALINLSCTIGHDSVIGRGSTLSPGVHVSGFVTTGEFVDIGTGAVIIPGVRIGKGSVIGAGAVIIRDVAEGVTIVGNPGKIVRKHDEASPAKAEPVSN